VQEAEGLAEAANYELLKDNSMSVPLLIRTKHRLKYNFVGGKYIPEEVRDLDTKWTKFREIENEMEAEKTRRANDQSRENI
jgi:hypothetical protein